MGDPEALYRIGLLYARGEGVVQSIPDAVVWYTRAAEAGHVDAQFQLGAIYLNGATSGQNGANNWFKSAAQRNGEAAQQNLDVLFPNGIVVEKDIEAAIRWIVAAARSGKAEAQLILGEMCRRGLGMAQNYELARRLVFIGRKTRECVCPVWVRGYLLSRPRCCQSIIRLALIGTKRPPSRATSEHGSRSLLLTLMAAAGQPIERRLRGCLFKQPRKATRAA